MTNPAAAEANRLYWETDTPVAETVWAMDALVRQGKVLYWGTSEWNAQQLTEAYAVARREHLTPPTMEQPQYNMFERQKVEGDYMRDKRLHELEAIAARHTGVDKVYAMHAGREIRVIVHPECPMPVVDAADENGSTDHIRKAVEAAEPGSTFAIGTEINMVNRLADQHPEHTIFCLDPVICPCSTMYRIHPGYLAWVLEELVAGRVINRISVDAATARDAEVALERMLAALPR